MKAVRSYLFLQGVCSPFFARLSDQLRIQGHRVYRINFTAGDWAYWGGRPAWNFRQDISEFREFLLDKFRKFEITDQILFGDRRPLHRWAIDTASGSGIRTHVFEEGYFRPFWITLEREGVNGHSLLPRDPNWFRAIGHCLPEYGNGESFRSSFSVRAAHDVAYHAAGLWNPLFFPQYGSHAPVNAWVEYGSYARRLPELRFCKSRNDALVADIIRSSSPYFFLPLQLGSDAQILDHSKFEDMPEVLRLIIGSFSRHAAKESKLVIKNHPLDTGLIDYASQIQKIARDADVTERVVYIETGDLEGLLRGARGTVTVNSTVGALALELRCPTIALGSPIYALPGLTHQGSLDSFWSNPESPDIELFRCFRNTVIHMTQLNGGFYSRAGIELAIKNSCLRLQSERSPLEVAA